MDLKSSIMEAVISPPFSLARAFCNDPRWSMAAAAITPRLLETAFIPASFPGVSFMMSLPVARVIVNVAPKGLQHRSKEAEIIAAAAAFAGGCAAWQSE